MNLAPVVRAQIHGKCQRKHTVDRLNSLESLSQRDSAI